MASPVTLRLKDATRKSIARIARRKRITPSHAMREAIETWVEQNEAGPTFYDRIKHLIGVAHGGDPKLSEDTGGRFYRMLREKHERE